MAADRRPGTAPPFVGIRGKCLEAPTRRRGVRTLDLFLGGCSRRPSRPWSRCRRSPTSSRWRPVLPVLDALEAAHGRRPATSSCRSRRRRRSWARTAPPGRPDGARAGPRLTGLHYGTYDYSAALGIAAAHQASDHPAADFAKQVMQVAVAGTGARAVDGSTNVLPVGDREQVHGAWRLHAGLVRRALERGFYQGWDLHPAQLVTRYTATYAFFRAALPAAAGRLAAYLDRVDGGRARRARHRACAGRRDAPRARLRRGRRATTCGRPGGRTGRPSTRLAGRRPGNADEALPRAARALTGILRRPAEPPPARLPSGP